MAKQIPRQLKNVQVVRCATIEDDGYRKFVCSLGNSTSGIVGHGTFNRVSIDTSNNEYLFAYDDIIEYTTKHKLKCWQEGNNADATLLCKR